MSLQIDCCADSAALQPWAAQWNALARAAPQHQPMLSAAWVEAYAQTLLPAGAQLKCLLAHQDGQLLGVLPLVVQTAGPRAWGIATAATPYEPHSAFGDMLADTANASTVLPALLRAACRLPHQPHQPRLHLRELALRGVEVQSPTLAALASLAQTAPAVRSVSNPRGWGSFLSVAGSWMAYRSSLSSNFAANLRKAHNRLREPQLPQVRFDWLTGDQASPQHLASFMALEAAGWKGRAGSAIAQSARLQRFYARLTGNAFAAGMLEWHFMRLGGKLIAAHLAWRCGRVLSLLKIAYDEDQGRLSPGSLLFEATAERAFARNDTDEINCLTDMPWHRPWNMQRREYLDLRLYPSTLLGVGLGLAPRLLVNHLRKGKQGHG